MKLENKLQASALKDQINLVTPSLPQYTQERITTITQQLHEILHEIYRTPHTQLSSNHDLSWLYLCRYFIHCYPMYEPTSHSHTLLQQQPGVGIGYLDKSLPFLTHAYGAEELEGDQEKLTQSIAQGSVCWRPKEGMELQKQYDIMMTNDEDGDSDIEDS